MLVRLNPAARLIPPSEVTGEAWLVENLIERKRYKVSRRAAATLVAANRPREPRALAEHMAELADEHSTEGWEYLVAALRDRNLIVDETVAAEDADLAWMTRLRQDWGRYGWHEAAEYHVLSYDYPCIDYSEAAAFHTDMDRMRGYQSQEPDADRVKLDYLDRPEHALPAPGADCGTDTANALWSGTVPPRTMDATQLATVLSLTFGRIGELFPRTDSAPLLRRSSPSGGGRHPSEGYVLVRDVDGCAAGWHHVTMSPFGLRRLDAPAAADAIDEAFPETMERFPYPVRALLVITSLFERNMYRYREPRTFRTVHMDAGHLAGTARLAARSLGLVAGIYYCDHATRIEQALGLDGMREGYMLTVAFADGVSPAATGGGR